MKKIVFNFLDFIFPNPCSFCGKFDFFASKLSLCKSCILKRTENVRISVESVCEVCQSPLTESSCEYCTSRNVFFSKLYSIRVKGELEKEIIQKIKFGNIPLLSNFFRIGIRRLIPKFAKEKYTNIVTIPSGKKTIRKRPIPVCLPIVLFLKRELGLKEISPFSKKSKELQSGKSFRERFIHAQKAFDIKKEFTHSLNGNYLLVDDVFTTGATINEIAKLLLLNGAKRVDVLVLVKGKT